MRGKTRVIYNGVDPDRVKPTMERSVVRAQMGISGKVLGYLGRLSTEKRLGALVMASTRLPRDWTVCIVGAGNRSKIKHMMSRQPRSRNKFVDARQDVKRASRSIVWCQLRRASDSSSPKHGWRAYR
jgi:glycosyltransferase involved in cell wall biosynthesis